MPFDIPRPTRVDPPAGNRLRAGAARVDITPRPGVGLGGHGPTANAAQGCFGRLFATVLLIEDDRGNRTALITADLHAGSRYLHERLGERMADIGLTTERILIAGTHTHRGPSSFYGNHSYDRLAGPAWVRTNWSAHFDQALSDAICDRIEAGVRSILGPATRTPDLVTLRRAKLGLAAPTCWGWLTNRSGAAHDGEQTSLDPDDFRYVDPPALTDADRRAFGQRLTSSAPPSWLGGPVPPGTPAFQPGSLGPNPPVPYSPAAPSGPVTPPSTEVLEDLIEQTFGRGQLGPLVDIAKVKIHSRRRKLRPNPLDTALVDARLHVLVARERRGDGRNGPLIGAMALFGATPSLFGAAQPLLSSDAYGWACQRVRAALPTPVPVGIGGGAVGDCNLTPRGDDLDDVRRQSRDFDSAVQMVRTVGDALGDALIDVLDRQALAYADDLTLSFAYDDFDPAAAGLDPQGILGGPALGGSELADSPLSALFEEGMREKPEYAEQQSPKARLPRLESPPIPLPMRLITLSTPTGPWWSIAGCPTECSHMLAAQIRDAVTNGAWPLSVASPCGEFGSYAGTRWEYVAQAYEGAATLHGRYQGDAMVARFGALPTSAPSGSAHFTSTAGTLPLRLGAKGEKKRDRPNLFVSGLEVEGARMKKLRRKGRPDFKVRVEGATLVLRGSFDGAAPDTPYWDGVFLGVGLANGARSAVSRLTFPTSGLPVDDRHAMLTTYCDVRKKRNRWYVEAILDGFAGHAPSAVFILWPALTGATGPRFLDADGLFDAALT
jgi:hypothetical protein